MARLRVAESIFSKEPGQEARPLESAMYAKVRQFLVDHWEASASLTRMDVGRGEGVSLNLGGIKVEPDVFGIVARDGVELPILGEGKRWLGGHCGTEAFGQALAYKNLGLLSFVFFPEDEFTNDGAVMMKALCSQAGVGLLKVPRGRRPIDAQFHVVVDMAGGQPAELARAVAATLARIKGIDQRKLGDIYPSSLRDMLHLFGPAVKRRDQLRACFRKRWSAFSSVLRQRPYDPMVAKKVGTNTARVREHYFGKFLGGLLALGLVRPDVHGFVLQPRGELVRSSTDPGELFTPAVSAPVLRLFAFALYSEFEDAIAHLVATFRHVGRPLSNRSYCLRRTCGYYAHNASLMFAWTDDGRLVSLKPRCPRCGGKAIELSLWGQQWVDAGRIVQTLDYSVLKFAGSTGLFEARKPAAWAGEFTDLPTQTPAGDRINWDHYWLGSALLDR